MSWRVVDEWSDGFPKELVFEKRLDRHQLCVMTREEVYRYFGVKPRDENETVSIPRPTALPVRHLFSALLSCRPACGRRLAYDASDCTFIRHHATCPGCLAATEEAGVAA